MARNNNKKFEKNSNPKGDNKKPQFKGDFPKTKEDIKACDNDISWYSHNTVLLQDSANIPYPYPVGSRLRREYQAKDGTGITHPYQILGIVKIMWRPSIGVSKDAGSNVNVAANNIYSFIRQANSGAKNYDAPDLMLYLLAMDSCYSFHAWMVRLYGILCNTVATNRYMPEALVTACGGDYADLISHIADFRYYVNFFGARLSAMAVPDTMYYFTRHRWMNSNIYCDEQSVKPQLYAFVPEGFWRFTYDTDGAGMCSFEALDVGSAVSTPKALTFDEIRQYGEGLLASILSNEDFNIMSGDILKAYSKIVQIPAITEDYKLDYVYSSEVLEQIHNIKTYNVNWTEKSWDVTQSAKKDHLLFQPTGISNNDSIEASLFLDSRFDMPTAQDTMIATRLSTLLEFNANKNTGEVRLATAGSEVVTAMFDMEFDTSEADIRTLISRRIYTDNYVPVTMNATTGQVTVSGTVWNRVVNALGSGSADRYPMRDYLVPRVYGSGSKWELKFGVKSLGQKNNVTIVPVEVLDRMHQAAILSLFGVPIMGNQ